VTRSSPGHRAPRTKWERMPSVEARSDSSRASSVEYSWDCGSGGEELPGPKVKGKVMGPGGDSQGTDVKDEGVCLAFTIF
jgi:hypothetical protein